MAKNIIDRIIKSASDAGYEVRTPYGVSRKVTPSYSIGKGGVGTLAIVSKNGEVAIMDSCGKPERLKLLNELEAQLVKDSIPFKRASEREAEQIPVEKTLEQLMTINLKVPLELPEFKKLLRYVATNLPGDINYKVSYFENLIHRNPQSKYHLAVRENGTVSVGGTIRHLHVPTAFDQFGTLPDEEDSSRIKAVRFNMVPGWELQDYRKEVVALWGDVAGYARIYFVDAKKGAKNLKRRR